MVKEHSIKLNNPIVILERNTLKPTNRDLASLNHLFFSRYISNDNYSTKLMYNVTITCCK